MDPLGSGHYSQSGGVRELASLSLNIQSKKFYLDVKENLSGRFVKIAEINVSGIKNKVIFDMTSTKVLLDHLVSFAEFYVSLGPQPLFLSDENSGIAGEGSSGAGARLTSSAHGQQISRPLRSESFKRLAFNRIYHIDLAQNDKGVFLKLSCANQSGGRQGKQTVVFPAQGIVELRDKLKLLVDEFYIQEVERTLPQSRKMAYDSRLLFLDVGHSNKGYYLKMSEISKNPSANYKRQTIQIPRKLWIQVRDALDQLYQETDLGEEEAEREESSASARPVSLQEELAAVQISSSDLGLATPQTDDDFSPSPAYELVQSFEVPKESSAAASGEDCSKPVSEEEKPLSSEPQLSGTSTAAVASVDQPQSSAQMS